MVSEPARRHLPPTSGVQDAVTQLAATRDVVIQGWSTSNYRRRRQILQNGCLTPRMIDSLKIIPDLCLSFTSVNQIWRGRTKSPSTLASVVPILKKGSTALQRISLVLTCFIRMKGLKLTSRRISHRLRLLRLSYEVPAKKKFYPLDNRQCSNNKYCV